jgi:hypothetical protein
VVKPRKGGPRPNAGRKPRPRKVLDGRTVETTEVADRVLATVDEVAYWRRAIRADIVDDIEWFKLSFDERKEANMNFRHLTERKYGKAVEKMQVSGLPPAVVDNSVTVVFQHVGGQP